MTGCSNEITSFADLGTKSIRAGGLFAAAWEPTGAQAVALPLGEVREAMERGLLDCWDWLAMDTVPDFGLHEVSTIPDGAISARPD